MDKQESQSTEKEQSPKVPFGSMGKLFDTLLRAEGTFEKLFELPEDVKDAEEGHSVKVEGNTVHFIGKHSKKETGFEFTHKQTYTVPQDVEPALFAELLKAEDGNAKKVFETLAKQKKAETLDKKAGPAAGEGDEEVTSPFSPK